MDLTDKAKRILKRYKGLVERPPHILSDVEHDLNDFVFSPPYDFTIDDLNFNFVEEAVAIVPELAKSYLEMKEALEELNKLRAVAVAARKWHGSKTVAGEVLAEGDLLLALKALDEK